MTIAVIITNLGGPDKLDAVEEFLFNLFYDKAIINLPNPFRWLLAKFISKRRAPITKEIYQQIGNKSPILEQTNLQAEKLEKSLNENATQESYKVFVNMRYWHPMAEETITQVKNYNPSQILVVPLYPQFSTTTTASAFKELKQHKQAQSMECPMKFICCYPTHEKFITSHVQLIKSYLDKINSNNVRVLFSAHGLPTRIIKAGDPYQYQVEKTTNKIIEQLGVNNLDYKISYQSKVGPLEWLTPSTEEEICQAGKDNKALLIVPIAFVSEHSETLVELDIEYKQLAEQYGIHQYYRVPTLTDESNYIEALKQMVENSHKVNKEISPGDSNNSCPVEFKNCLCQNPELI